MTETHKLIAEHSQLLKNQVYAYISSTGLFLLLKNYSKIPSDFDIALDWQKKGKKELIDLYKTIKNHKKTSKICFKTIESQTTTSYSVKKNQKIFIKSPFFEELLIQGNIKLTYIYDTMPVELFPEQEGNGVTNIDVCAPHMHYLVVDNKQVAVLDTLEIAKRYVVNFIDEISQKRIIDFKNPDYKHKDAIRLNTIIQILYAHKMDCSPTGVISFMKATINELKLHLAKANKSVFMQNILENYPKISKKLNYIAGLYKKIYKTHIITGGQEIDFSQFHFELKQEITKMHDLIELYQANILKNLSINRTSFLKKIKQLEYVKIQKYVTTINLTNKINGFAYFYEFYFIKDMIKRLGKNK